MLGILIDCVLSLAVYYTIYFSIDLMMANDTFIGSVPNRQNFNWQLAIQGFWYAYNHDDGNSYENISHPQ